MKDILFRGKTETGRWAYGSLILAGTYCCILESEKDVHPSDYPYLDPDLGFIDGKATPVIRETVGRLIECPDYNRFVDEQYFEGDIVDVFPRHYRSIDPVTQVRPWYQAILIDEHCLTEKGCGHKYTQDTVVVKVIGNIHDNPELIDKRYIDAFKHYHCLESKEK